MVCYNKMLAKRNKKTGVVTFVGAVSKYTPQEIKRLQNLSSNFDYIKLPCGRCIGCRLSKAREWAVRIMHENMTSTTSSFITLTFDEKKLFDYFYNFKHLGEKKSYLKSKQLLWTLDTKVFQDFMKRLRKDITPLKIRFFHTGEYGGSGTLRPHHHAIIFGYDFPDKKERSYKKLGNKIIRYYVSEQLSKLWPFGYHIITDVTEDSACYCARYVTKKINGSVSDLHYNGRKKEYITMSRNKGIGYDWFQKFGDTDCFPQDFLFTAKGHKIKPPRYYDSLYDKEAFAEIKANREAISHDIMMNLNHISHFDETKERQQLLNDVNAKKLQKLIRCYEDENIHNDRFIEIKNKCSAFGIPFDVINPVIDRCQELENKNIDAVTMCHQFIDEEFGRLTYKDMEVL